LACCLLVSGPGQPQGQLQQERCGSCLELSLLVVTKAAADRWRCIWWYTAGCRPLPLASPLLPRQQHLLRHDSLAGARHRQRLPCAQARCLALVLVRARGRADRAWICLSSTAASFKSFLPAAFASAAAQS
jgi:hypothetical protein